MSGVTSSGDRSGAFGSLHGNFISGDNSSVTNYVLPENIPDVAEVRAPTAWNVPRPPSTLFVGRERELAELHEVLSSGQGVIGQTVKGLGGVGKSELALQYAYARRAEFTSVWWITADSLANLTRDLAKIASAVLPALRVVPPDVAAQWALNWLQLHPGWLAVLDNVEQPEDIDAFLAGAKGSHVLVTTRRDVDWRRRGLRSVRLGSLPEEKAIQFLLDATEQDDRVAARSVAAALGGLPLALEQAAAYVTTMETTLAEYANRLAQEPEEAFGFDGGGPAGQERAISKVWRLTIKALLKQAPGAVALLDVLAWLGPDELPRDLVTNYAGGDRPAADRMLGALKSYSMITLTGGFVSVHRLVQAVLRLTQRELTDTGIAPAAETAVELLASVIPDDPEEGMSGWPRWSALLPHAQALGSQVGGDNRSIPLSRLLNQAGLFASVQGLHSTTITFAELALQIGRAVMAPDDPALATLLGNLGAAQHAAGHSDRSAELEEQALSIAERAYGRDDSRVALLLSNLASSYNALGRPHDAVSLHLRALRICEESTGPETADVARYLASLAAVYTELGQTADAVPLEERALALTLRFYEPDHILVAYRTSALAASHRELGSPDKALTLDQRAVAIGEKRLKEDHPDLASFYGGLAASHGALDEEEKALPLREKALAIVRAAYEEGHPDIAVALSNLASTYHTLGRIEEAVTLEEEALRITSASRGAEHPDMAARMSNLASAYRRLDRAEEALSLDRQALVITQRSYGPDHRDVATRLGSLATSLLDLGRSEEAVPLLLRAIKISRETYGDEHLDVAVWSARLGRAYTQLGRYEEASEVYLTAMLVTQQAQHPDHPDVAQQLSNRAVVLNRLDRQREALPLLRRALTIEEMAYGRQAAELLDRLDLLVDTYEEVGDEVHAAAYQRRFVEVTVAVHGPEGADAAKAHGRLGNLCYRLGRYAEAIAHEETALEITEHRLAEPLRERWLRLRLENLAASYSSDGRAEEALPMLRRALAIAEQEDDPVETAECLSRLGALLFRLCRYREAAPLEERAVAITEDPELRLVRLDSLAYTYDALGDNQRLLDVRRAAIGLARQAGADDLAGRLNNLAEACCIQDDHDGAEVALIEAIGLTEEAQGRLSIETAESWQRLATVRYIAARNAEAEAAARTAVEIAEQVLAPGDARMVEVLEALALPLRELHRYEEALPVQRRAIAAAEAAYGPDVLEVAEQLGMLGNTYYRLGQPGNSIPLEQRALAIAEVKLPADDRGRLLRLQNLAESYRLHGRAADAVPLLRRALDLARRTPAPDPEKISDLENDLAAAENDQ